MKRALVVLLAILSAVAVNAGPILPQVSCSATAVAGCAIVGSVGGGGYTTIQEEGSSLTQRTTLNFTGAGATCIDSGGKTECTITSGSGTPAGADTQVQFNNAGAFGGDTSFIWDSVGNSLSIGGAAGAAGSTTFTGSSWTIEGSTADANELSFTFADPAADVPFNLFALAGGGFRISGAATWAFDIPTTIFGGAVDAAGTTSISSIGIEFEGATANAFETTLAVTDPTADVTFTLPALGAGTYNLLTDPGGNGMVARTSAGVTVARTITASAGGLVTNGDGVSGNPTVGPDPATQVSYSSGGGDVPATGAVGTLYFETDALSSYTYPATDTEHWLLSIAAGATAGQLFQTSATDVLAAITSTDDNTMVSNGSTWEKKALPDCDDTGGNHLNYDTGTNAYSCGTSGSGGSSIGFALAATWVIESEMYFTGAADIVGGFTATNAGTGSGVAPATPEASHPSVVDFATGTTTTGNGSARTRTSNDYGGTEIAPAGGTVHLTAWMKLSAVSDGTDTYTAVIGLSNATNTITPADGAFFRYTHSVNSAKWVGVCAEDTAETAVNDTGSAVAAATWYKLDAEINAAASSVQFWVNDVSLGTCGTNVPDSNDPLSFNVRIVKSAGTTSRTMTVDVVKAYGTFTTPR